MVSAQAYTARRVPEVQKPVVGQAKGYEESMRDFCRAALMLVLALALAWCLFGVVVFALPLPPEGWEWLGKSVWPWMAAGVVVAGLAAWAAWKDGGAC